MNHRLDDTAIVHTSDHGYFLGEWRMFDKRLIWPGQLEGKTMMPLARSADPSFRKEWYYHYYEVTRQSPRNRCIGTCRSWKLPFRKGRSCSRKEPANQGTARAGQFSRTLRSRSVTLDGRC